MLIYLKISWSTIRAPPEHLITLKIYLTWLGIHFMGITQVIIRVEFFITRLHNLNMKNMFSIYVL